MITFTLQAASIRRLRSPLSPTSASRRSGKEEFLVEGAPRAVTGGVRQHSEQAAHDVVLPPLRHGKHRCPRPTEMAILAVDSPPPNKSPYGSRKGTCGEWRRLSRRKLAELDEPDRQSAGRSRGHQARAALPCGGLTEATPDPSSRRRWRARPARARQHPDSSSYDAPTAKLIAASSRPSNVQEDEVPEQRVLERGRSVVTCGTLTGAGNTRLVRAGGRRGGAGAGRGSSACGWR